MVGYRNDLGDGLRAMEVGSWAKEKHKKLRHYIQASSATRRKYLGPSKAGSIYLDPFCGPGRSAIRDTDEFISGGAITAWEASVASQAPFSEIHIGDIDPVNVRCCKDRLTSLGAKVVAYEGLAEETSSQMVKAINHYGLHLAFLDPFSIGSLNFNIIEALSCLRRMDILLNVNVMDLQRNLGMNRQKEVSDFDNFAPGWQDHISSLPSTSREEARGKVIEHWQGLIRALDMNPSAYFELITADKNQPLYWLTFISRSTFAEHLWNEIRKTQKQDDLFESL